MNFDAARVLRASRVRVGPLRASGAPAIFLGIATVILATGLARTLGTLAPLLPETLRETKGLIENRQARRPVADEVIDEQTMVGMIRGAMPDAQVDVWDRTGTMDHFDVLIRSSAFAGKSLLDRHRMVERALKPARDDGRIHALAIRTELLET